MSGSARNYLTSSHNTGGLGGAVGLPMEYSNNAEDVFYTTNEAIVSLPFLEEHVSGKDAYEISPLVRQINEEVVFPRHRLPTDIYAKFMREINARLPLCTNEKRGHEFKHCRIHVDRNTSQKLANKPKDIMTSQCINCKQHWTGLRYPLQIDERFPEGMSLYRQRTFTFHETKHSKVSSYQVARKLLASIW